MELFYQQQGKRDFQRIHQQVYEEVIQRLDLPMAVLTLRKMTASWGRCYPQQCKIVLNRKLIKSSERCIKQVFVHEYVHFIHPNHSAAFYHQLEQLIPDYRQITEELTMTVNIRE